MLVTKYSDSPCKDRTKGMEICIVKLLKKYDSGQIIQHINNQKSYLPRLWL